MILILRPSNNGFDLRVKLNSLLVQISIQPICSKYMQADGLCCVQDLESGWFLLNLSVLSHLCLVLDAEGNGDAAVAALLLAGDGLGATEAGCGGGELRRRGAGPVAWVAWGLGRGLGRQSGAGSGGGRRCRVLGSGGGARRRCPCSQRRTQSSARSGGQRTFLFFSDIIRVCGFLSHHAVF